MLHSIGVGQPSAERMATAYNTYKPNGSTVCVHAFLEPDKVVQILPWEKQAWHSGGYANQTHIGVEMCEPSSIKYTGGATFNCTDTEAAREYVRGCYDTAVELFAQLCKTYGIDPMTGIISHAEGWQSGVASNHGDPEHLWRGLGLSYTMDGFRQAVKEKMEVKKMTYAEEFERAKELGITDGSNPDNPATRKQTAVMIYRAIKIVLKIIGGAEV